MTSDPMQTIAIALVESLIKMDPHDRLDFPLVLQSAWMNDQVLPTEVRPEVLQNMRRLHDRRLKFKVCFQWLEFNRDHFRLKLLVSESGLCQDGLAPSQRDAASSS